MKRQEYVPSAVCSCPHCSAAIPYYWFSGMSGLAPHFYCTMCSNVVWRAIDADRLQRCGATEQLLLEIAAGLPPCPCGGRFAPGANPKCPHCGRELAHQSDSVERLSDPFAIVVEGAALFTD